DYYNDFILLTDFYVKDCGIDGHTLGSAHFRSYWDTEIKSLIVGAENRVGREMPLRINGYYNPSTDSLDVNVKLEKVGLERLRSYASEMLSEVDGYLSGNVSVSGVARHPDISGFVYLDSVGLKINALNTKFFVHDSIRIDRSRFLFRNFSLTDPNGSQAILNGEYRVFDNLYKLNAQFEHFLVLNTGFSDNEAFYGRMVLSGLAELDNAHESVNVTVNAQTESTSQLSIPLTESLTERSSNFLHFITSDAQEIQNSPVSGIMSDINLNANLEVNDNLNVQVIFDPTVGDVLRTRGNGNIKIDFGKDGHLNMFGEYQITKGDYLFTLSNLVNKKFVLTPGGTINWSGSPYDAMLDINAVYNLKTSITELLPVETSAEGEDKVSEGRKVPVECVLNLSEKLTNPVVKFDIDFPTLDAQNKSYVQSTLASEDEKNKQVFSLLVLNHFYRTDDAGDYGAQAQTAGVTTLTEMFANQISRWFSKYNENVDIGLAYRFGDRENEFTSDELEVAVSTQLLNDRITISANGNVDVGGNRNTADSRKTNIGGDFDVEVKLNKQGSLKMKAYSHTDEKLLYNNTETIQGVGVSYQESFDSFRELLKKYFGVFRRKKSKYE
ncbi:MAG: translocation/assembly module TamB, partial [Odoribacter sp.]|nr:translocation/assembly module TamB [Odoribacter sp.]